MRGVEKNLSTNTPSHSITQKALLKRYSQSLKRPVYEILKLSLFYTEPSVSLPVHHSITLYRATFTQVGKYYLKVSCGLIVSHRENTWK